MVNTISIKARDTSPTPITLVGKPTVRGRVREKGKDKEKGREMPTKGGAQEEID